MGEFDCPQVNLHEGKKWAYWFIQPAEKPLRLPLGEIPAFFQGRKLDWINEEEDIAPTWSANKKSVTW